MRLSLAAPVFASPGIPMMRTPSIERVSWGLVRDAVVTAEQLGYDSVWFSDHLFHGRDGEFFESWSALCMAAGFTDRIRLVNNHLGNGLRDARMVAKMATTVAAATDGRFDLFLARGYREREYASYGLPFEDEATRARKLTEGIDIVERLWSGEVVDYAGEFYTLHDARATPTTSRRPFVWAGGPLDDESLRLVATRADGWNSFPCDLDAYLAAAARVDAACAAAGRDPSTLRRSLETQVLILEDDSEWQGWLDRWRQLRELHPLGSATRDIHPATANLSDDAVTNTCRSQFLVGTRDHVAERIAAYSAAGVTDLVCWFMDAPSSGSMTALKELVG